MMRLLGYSREDWDSPTPRHSRDLLQIPGLPFSQSGAVCPLTPPKENSGKEVLPEAVVGLRNAHLFSRLRSEARHTRLECVRRRKKGMVIGAEIWERVPGGPGAFPGNPHGLRRALRGSPYSVTSQL